MVSPEEKSNKLINKYVKVLGGLSFCLLAMVPFAKWEAGQYNNGVSAANNTQALTPQQAYIDSSINSTGTNDSSEAQGYNEVADDFLILGIGGILFTGVGLLVNKANSLIKPPPDNPELPNA